MLLFAADQNADVVYVVEIEVVGQDVLPVPAGVADENIGSQAVVGAETVAVYGRPVGDVFSRQVVDAVQGFNGQTFEQFQLAVDRSLNLIGFGNVAVQVDDRESD